MTERIGSDGSAMTPEEISTLRAFAHLADQHMPDAGVTLCALATVLVELRPQLTLTQNGVLFAAGARLASLAKREVEAADQVAALFKKLGGD
jgi:hypothetical protein